ncbi:MAG: hypothetical protein OEV44_07120, partial [Spirochaetota bacterium]|nr:hypothetical protein [Spirochaetota bacterium]
MRYFKKLFFTLCFTLLASSIGWTGEKNDESGLKFVGLVDINMGFNKVKKPDLSDNSHFTLSEVRFGVEWKISELVFVHADILMEGNKKDGFSAGPGDVFGEITLSKNLPIHIKAGKYELPIQLTRKQQFTVTDSWVIDSTNISTGAGELGFTYKFVRMGFGMFESKSNIISKPNTNDNISEIFTYLTLNPTLAKINLFMNLAYASHVGDSPVGGEIDYTNKIGSLTAEFKAVMFNLHILASAFFRMKNDDNFNTKNAFRGEIAYNFGGISKYPFKICVFTDIKKLAPATKAALDESELRIGTLIGYEVAAGTAINLEGWTTSVGKEESMLKLQLIF